MEAKKGHLIRLGEVITKLKSDNEQMKLMLERLFCRIPNNSDNEILIRDYKKLLTKINQ